jgi:hypothetical protein
MLKRMSKSIVLGLLKTMYESFINNVIVVKCIIKLFETKKEEKKKRPFFIKHCSFLKFTG